MKEINLRDLKYCVNCEDSHETKIIEKMMTYNIKGTEVEAVSKKFYCVNCEKEIKTKETIQENLNAARLKYEELNKYSAEYLKKIRKDLNLSQTLFAKLISVGEATIKRYESKKTTPGKAVLKIYKDLEKDPSIAVSLYEKNKANLNSNERTKIELELSKMGLFKGSELLQELNEFYSAQLYSNKEVERFYPDKTIKLIQYFSNNENRGVLKTKLMKLLWYSDFLMYKKFKKSITGLTYSCYPFGPVPYKHNFLIGYANKENFINIKEEESANGYTRINIISNENIDLSSNFTQEEKEVIEHVANTFANYSSKDISDFSHEEDAWKETPEREVISYKYAEKLNLDF